MRSGGTSGTSFPSGRPFFHWVVPFPIGTFPFLANTGRQPLEMLACRSLTSILCKCQSLTDILCCTLVTNEHFMQTGERDVAPRECERRRRNARAGAEAV